MKAKTGLFTIDKSNRGLLALEWLILAYAIFTTIMIIFTSTKHADPTGLIAIRVQNVAVIFAMWLVYYILPCKATLYLRVTVLAASLSWWYPDTYEINKVLTNYDHVFAGIDQEMFGYQPALYFCRALPKWISEFFYFGYWMYYPMIAIVLVYYIFKKPEDFLKVSFVLIGSFFACYVIYDVLPVAGPMFYYEYVGEPGIKEGIFPAAGDHFIECQKMWTPPGNENGIFYKLVHMAHEAGERPTAAFPSSHVGCATVMMGLALISKCKNLFFGLLPVYLLLCFATVYIRAHYAIDSIVGFGVGVTLFLILLGAYKFFKLR